MSPELHELYQRLADGRRHSGEELAEELGISRAAIWKRIESLRRLGLPVTGTAGGGYRADHTIELLDSVTIERHLGRSAIVVEVVGAVDSTNARLAAGGDVHARALVAEAQDSGRGRRGRRWLSPLGGIYLSLGWRFESGLAGLAPLSLVVGMSAAEAISRETGAGVRVKWPNDLVIDDEKLGGCLVEISGAAEGPCQAIIGIGINFQLSPATELDQPWTSVVQHARQVSRNRLVARLLTTFEKDLNSLDERGFEHFARRWAAMDALAGRRVQIIRADGSTLAARADGVDEQGRLLVTHRGKASRLSAGEVSVRGR